MKYRFALLALMAVSAAPLAAQGGGATMRGGGRGPQTYEQLNTLYGFTAEQKPKVEAAMKTRDDIVNPIRTWQTAMMQAAQAGGGQPAQNADSTKKMQDANAAFTATLKSILAGPQIAKFDSVQAAAAQRGGGRRGGGGGI